MIAHRYLYDHLKILHCDLSASNVLLNRTDDESEPVGLLIDYDYSVNTISEAVNHQDASTVNAANRVIAASDAQVPKDTEESVVVEARTQRQVPRTVRFSQLLEMSTNHDLRAGYTALYGHRGSS